MKRRFAVLIDWNPQVAGGRMALFGTWQTERLAELQAKRWERRIIRELGDDYDGSLSQFTIEVIELEPKSGRLRRWLHDFLAGVA